MSLNLKVPDEAAKLVKDHAALEYCGAIERYATDLFEEASRLEAANRGAEGHPEITSTMVRDANILLRRGYTRPPKKPLLVGAQLVATVGGFLTGLLADMDRLKEAGTLIGFVALLAVTITAAVVALVKE